MTGSLMERLDDIPKPAWIALLVVSFILFWPIGLALLIYLKWSGRMFCSRSLRSLVRTRRPRSPPRGARRMAFLEAPPWLGPRQRQCRLRRISRGDASPARRGTARVPRLPRPAARRQGPLRVRPVHERAAQPAARRRTAGSDSLRLRQPVLRPSRRPRREGFSMSVIQLHRQSQLDRPLGEIEQHGKGIARVLLERRIVGQRHRAPRRRRYRRPPSRSRH